MGTHCLPNGLLGTGELPVPSISGATIGVISATTGVGHRRGVCVVFHGLINSSYAPIPNGFGNNNPALGLDTDTLLFANQLAADGWDVIMPPNQEDTYVVSPSSGLYNDIANDTGYGLRYLNSSLREWDHIYNYIQSNYQASWGTNSTIPVIGFGFSLGGAKMLHLVTKHPSPNLTAYAVHCPATLFEPVNPNYTPGVNLGLLNASGIDVINTNLNAITTPGIIGYGTADGAIGYSSTTVASGSTGLTPAQVQSAGILYVASFSTLTTGPRVLVTGLTGGGQAVFAYTGTSTSGGNQLTGVTLVSTTAPSSTLLTGNPVQQSDLATMIANQQAAQPSNQVTANVTADNHEFPAGDAGQYTTPTGISGSVALSTLTTTLNVGTTVSGTTSYTNLVSGACAILASDGLWHTITFGSSTATSLSTNTFSGSNTATVNNSSPICQTNYAVGGAYPYWIAQNADPLCPQKF